MLEELEWVVHGVVSFNSIIFIELWLWLSSLPFPLSLSCLKTDVLICLKVTRIIAGITALVGKINFPPPLSTSSKIKTLMGLTLTTSTAMMLPAGKPVAVLNDPVCTLMQRLSDF